MKILAVTSSYPRFRGDIAGRFVFEWATHLEGRGHDLEILTWRDSSARNTPLDAPRGSPQRVIRVPYAPAGCDTLFYGAGTPENLRENPLRAFLAVPATAAMLARMLVEIARFGPDVLVGHWLVPSGLLVRAVGRLLGIPTLVIGHSGGVHMLDRLPQPIGQMIARFVASGPVTTSSVPLAEKFGRLAGSQASVRVLPMGFEASSMPVLPTLASARAPRSDWLCIGRLVDIKGVDLAIEAFASAAVPGRPTLHVAGDGPRRAELEQLAERVNAQVKFHGFVTGPAKEKLWQQCGYALFCSKELDDGRHEGLPVSFLEACSRGLLPVCAPIPGLGAYLAELTLQQVDSREPLVWAQRIAKVAGLGAEERARLVGRQGELVAELAWPRLIRRWELLLGGVCEAP